MLKEDGLEITRSTLQESIIFPQTEKKTHTSLSPQLVFTTVEKSGLFVPQYFFTSV